MSIKYTKDHEWIKLTSDNKALVGISNHAQEALGDITFVEMPKIGDEISKGDVFGVVESVKVASDLYMPVDAKILNINSELESAPELINQDALASWIIEIEVANPAQLDSLLSEADYEKEIVE